MNKQKEMMNRNIELSAEFSRYLFEHAELEKAIPKEASLDRKIDKVSENLTEKNELNSFKIDVLNKKIDDVDARLSAKIDGVAKDLSAHRTDTESHGKGYKASDG